MLFCTAGDVSISRGALARFSTAHSKLRAIGWTQYGPVGPHSQGQLVVSPFCQIIVHFSGDTVLCAHVKQGLFTLKCTHLFPRSYIDTIGRLYKVVTYEALAVRAPCLATCAAQNRGYRNSGTPKACKLSRSTDDCRVSKKQAQLSSPQHLQRPRA